MDARYPFTQEGERDLIRRAKRDDLDARNRLMSAFFEAARAGCRHHGKLKGLDPDDAESEAYFALEEAIYGFDLRRRGVRFSTYLGQRCRGAATLAAREQKKQSLSDPQGWRFKEKPPPNSKANGAIVGPIGPVCQYWPPPAIAWAEGIRRRNDKLIAKWLWLDEDPLRQVEIAKRLKISRAAVSQRRKLLLSELRRLHPDALMEQDHVPETLDTEEEDDDDLSLEDFIRSFLKGSRRMRSYKLPRRGHP